MQLIPTPDTMGLGAPVLGPWFTDANITLALPTAPRPGAGLAVVVTVANDTRPRAWLPAATGHFMVRRATRVEGRLPRGIDRLRGPDGTSPFTADDHVAVLELLPQVRVRLSALQSSLPTVADGATVGAGAGRTAIRWLTLDWTSNNPAELAQHVDPRHPLVAQAETATTADILARLGLQPDGSNRAAPAGVRLVRPGTSFEVPGLPDNAPFDESVRDRLVHLQPGGTYRLRAFDVAGRAVDPGAVAAWWLWLATVTPGAPPTADTTPSNLWASGVPNRTAPTTAGLFVHLVNAHEGPAQPDAVARTTAAGLNNLTASAGTTLFQTSGNPAGVTVPGDNNVDENPAPVLRVALLPDGLYAGAVSLWTAAPAGNLAITRDYVRLGLVSVERHLVGISRDRDASPMSNPLARAAVLQSTAHLRVPVNRTVAPTLLAGVDAVTGAALAALSSGGPGWLFTQALDPDWSAFPATPPGWLPAVDAPTARPTLRGRALAGRGRIDGALTRDQQVLVEVDLDVSLVGCWVRLWTRRTDLRTGLHVRMAGAAGRAVAATDDQGQAIARAYLVLDLPDGSTDPAVPSSLDGLIVTGNGSRLFSELPLDRPAPVPGADAPASAGDVILCELGTRVTGGTLPAGSLPPDVHDVVLSDPPARLDRTTVPATAWQGPAWRTTATATTTAVITPPPWSAQPTGTADDAPLAPATVVRRDRNKPLELGRPMSGQHRLEQVAVSDGAATGPIGPGGPPISPTAVVGGAVSRSGLHEQNAHRLGHPGMPAAGERGVVGVRLTNGAAADVVERSLPWRATDLDDLMTQLGTTPVVPPPVTGPSPWAAVLRTASAGTDLPSQGLGVLGALAQLPWGDDLDALNQFLTGIDPRLGLPNVLSPGAARTLQRTERYLVGAGWGHQEALVSLIDAIGRAEDLIYLETSALDGLDVRAGTSLWNAITRRVDGNPNVGLVVCVPALPGPGTPGPATDVQHSLFRRTWAAIDRHPNDEGQRTGEQIAWFSPSAGPGRGVRLPTTAVLIDDAYALIGSTPLSRRGLTFDSSLSVAVFDETLTAGRPAQIVALRTALIGQRLGLTPAEIPASGRGLARLVRALHRAGGHGRLASPGLGEDRGTQDVPASGGDLASVTLTDVWNPDGLRTSALDGLDATFYEQALGRISIDDTVLDDVLDLEDP